MSIAVPIPQLFDQLDRWGFCYLLTVSDDQRPHLLALRPEVVGAGDGRVLRFEVGAGRAGRNAAQRPEVSVVFPPAEHSEGFSLVVDGRAGPGTSDGFVDTPDGFLDVVPTWAVLHRPAP